MILFGRDLDKDVAVVAEIGVNHEGNVDVASRILAAAAKAGADAVKLQSYTPERYTSASDAERFARVSRVALDIAAHDRLAAEAKAIGIPLFSTPLSEDWVQPIAEFAPAIKIASGDLTFETVIRAAARTGKPVLLSTGCGVVDEIDRAVGWVRDEVGPKALNERLVLLHCVSGYPTPIEQANVRAVPFLKARYGLPVGYSNHVIGSEAVLAAAALGAAVIEVHVTDANLRETSSFRDHRLSFTGPELAALIQSIRGVKSALGDAAKTVQAAEAGNRDAIRKGIVAKHDLAAGVVLTDDDLLYARPATQFLAAERPTLIGRRLLRALRRGEIVPRDAVK